MTAQLRLVTSWLLGLALLAVVAVVGPLPSAMASTGLLASINAARAAAGVGAVKRVSDMDSVAQRWSERMAATGVLQHNPSCGTEIGNWQAIAENVGYGSSESQVHQAFMASAGHRKNIVNTAYSEVGIGIASRGGRLWITEVFRRPTVPASFAATMTDTDAGAYVDKVYSDLLSRRPDASGRKHWSNQLKNGAPKVSVANAITSSPEFRSQLISESYKTYLERRPDSGGLQHWLALMGTGWTVQDMESGFLGSAEFYTRSGGTSAGWVRNLYGTVLLRQASAAEVSGWVAALQRGATRQQVARSFLLSTEKLSTTVDGYYRWLLRRGLDSAGRTSWVRAIQSGSRVEQVIGGIVGSREYFSR